MEFFDFIKNNFMHVAPILGSGIIAVAIMAERAQTLFKGYSIPNTEGFFDQIRDLVSHGKNEDAMAL